MNLCKPIHKRFNIAITKVLGRNMNAIIVDSEQTARKCIQYLKDAMVEPETFLPLNYIDAKPVKERLRNIQHPKGVKLLYDVIKYDPPAIKQAVLYATNNALVCETAEDASTVAFELGDGKRYDAVSLDGTFYQKCGFISGGSLELEKRAKRWDEKEVHKLKQEKDKLTEDLKEQLKRTRKESDLMMVQNQIKGLESRKRYCQNDQDAVKSKQSEIEKKIRKLRDDLEPFDPRLREMKVKIDEKEDEIKDVREKMNQVEDEVFREFCARKNLQNIREYEEKQTKASQEAENRRLHLLNKKSALDNRREFENDHLKQTEAKLNRWQQIVNEEKENLQKVFFQIIQFQNPISEFQNTKGICHSKIKYL